MEPYPANVVALPAGSGNIQVFQFFVHENVVQVLVLRESLWVYVGRHDQQTLDNVTLMMMNGADSSLLGSSEEGRQIAGHLQKRFKLGACFVSYNGSLEQAMEVAGAIIKEIASRKLFQ